MEFHSLLKTSLFMMRKANVLHRNETIASKVEKQYNGYITHSHSNFFKQVIIAYGGSFFVRH